MLAVIVALAILSGPLWWSRAFASETFDPPRFNDMVPATPVEADELQRIVLDYHEASIDARLTNDTSTLSTYLYNDPYLDTWQECDAVFAEHAGEIDLRLSAGQAGPVGAPRGLLSCEVGFVVEAWAYATERATADAALPFPASGYTPAAFMRQQVGARISQTTYFHQPLVTSTGRYATISQSHYADADIPMQLHYTFTNVDGRWYISAQWSDCRKDTPCA